jgi:hypothetical protein
VLRKGYKQTERAVARTRDIGTGISDQTGKVVERTRDIGAGLAETTQSLVGQVQKLAHRNGER